MSTDAPLDEASIEAIAQRVIELQQRLGMAAMTGALVDVAEVARRFGVSNDYVYRHADELGAIRLGEGKRSRLRFDLNDVARRIAERGAVREPEAKPVRQQGCAVRRGRGADLLPVKGETV